MEYELQHHGIKGMKWGVRRFQNKDGSLTPAGRKRAARLEYQQAKSEKRAANAEYRLAKDKYRQTKRAIKDERRGRDVYDPAAGKGMGVRKYQNKDGSLTEEGRKRLKRDIDENNAKKKDNRIIIDKDDPDVNRWVKEDIKRRKTVVDETGNVVKKLNDFETRTRPSKQRMDLSHMTDRELREQIDRRVLENRYNDLFAQDNVSRGRTYAQKAIKYGGEALALTGTALSIALALKELKG